MKTLICYSITTLMIALSFVASNAIAAPQISIYTDKQSYHDGDKIEVSLSGISYYWEEGVYVDIYVGLLTPMGSLYTVSSDGWSEGIRGPWVEDFYFNWNSAIGRTRYFSFPLPCESPPIGEPGEYVFLAALTKADTADLLDEINSAGFKVGMPQAADYYVDAELGDDKNFGTSDAPWCSITHALNSLESLQESPTTIHVSPGKYEAGRESFPLNMKSWVSLIADEPGAIFDSQRTSSVIYCVDVQEVEIRGFTITGGGPAGYLYVKYGGGIYCNNSSVLIANNTIIDNEAGWEGNSGGGGGIYCCGGTPVIVSNMIMQNVAKQYCAAEGGGILCNRSRAIIANNTIIENTASGGGGIAVWGFEPVLIVNNSIVDNDAWISGIMGSNADETEILDCIIWGDEDELVGYASAQFCCIEGGYPGEGNIDLDPLFAERPSGEFRYYLHPNSPCIDAGSRSAEEAWLSGMTTQADGTPDTGIVDMGAHYPIPD